MNQKRFTHRFDATPLRQRVFRYENKLLASMEAAEATRIKRVWDQAWANRLWTPIPMLPTPTPTGWRSTPREERSFLQNTFQTSALAIDMGVQRAHLANFQNFRHFEIAAREAVRLFDLRVGPPWWSTDREWLEMAYTAVMHQEEPDEETSELCESYFGVDGVKDMPRWEGQCFLDAEHAASADVIGQAWHHYYEGTYANPRLKPGKSAEDAKATILLNWQVTHQPRIALETVAEPDDRLEHVRTNTFPHRHELRRIVRALNSKPRGRPQKSIACLS